MTERKTIDRKLDAPVVVASGRVLRLSADSLRALKKATGRTMSELLNDEDDEAARFQVMAFAELYRRYLPGGHMPDAGKLWDMAGAIEIDFETEMAADPTPGGFSTGSPLSADIGE